MVLTCGTQNSACSIWCGSELGIGNWELDNGRRRGGGQEEEREMEEGGGLVQAMVWGGKVS